MEIRRGAGTATVTFSVSPISAPVSTASVRLMIGTTPVFVGRLVDKYTAGSFTWTPPFITTPSPSASISLSPQPLRIPFSLPATGEIGTARLEIRSVGNGPLTVHGITYSTAPWCSGDWSGIIAPGNTQTVNVTCSNFAQFYNTTLTVYADHSSGRNTVNVCVGNPTVPSPPCS